MLCLSDISVCWKLRCWWTRAMPGSCRKLDCFIISENFFFLHLFRCWSMPVLTWQYSRLWKVSAICHETPPMFEKRFLVLGNVWWSWLKIWKRLCLCFWDIPGVVILKFNNANVFICMSSCTPTEKGSWHLPSTYCALCYFTSGNSYKPTKITWMQLVRWGKAEKKLS